MIEFIWSNTCGKFELKFSNGCFEDCGKITRIVELSNKGWCRISFENQQTLDIGDIYVISRASV